MGKIKSKLVKRTAHKLEEAGIKFSTKFEANKRTLGNTMPSKKIRNQLAGYAVRLKKQQKTQSD